MESIWRKTVKIKMRPHLSDDVTTEAAVIGGGLAGILTAFMLEKKNIKTVVLEAARIGSGQTGNTTAKITSQHNIIYSKVWEQAGQEKTEQYKQANQNAISDYRSIIEEENIDCSFEERPAYLYSQNPQDEKTLQNEAEAAKRLGIDAEFKKKTELSFPVAGAVKFSGQAQFNPLAFLEAISRELNIYEQTRAISVEEDRILTDGGTVRAKHIIFATHYPFINVPGFFFARMHQERSYVLALQNAVQIDGMYLGIDEDGLSFRNFNDVLLLGGGGHRTGENSKGGKYRFLRERAAELYPQSREVTSWSAQDCITLDGIPYIGRFSDTKPNWYAVTGFAKWGMTSSMVSAALISDLIAGIDNPCTEVFSPLRFTPAASAKTFFSDMGQAIKGISKQTFNIPEKDLEELPRGHGGIVEHDGEKAGIYKDESGKVHIVSTRCPHLGCQLEWNPDEKSWDCPCHGSRFDYKGATLDNPAQTDLETLQ